MFKSVGEFIKFTTFLSPASKKIVVSQIRGRRRTLTPPPWVPPKYEKVTELLDSENEFLLKEISEMEKSGSFVRSSVSLPIINNENVKKEWTPNSKRVGLLGTKIGMFPQWLNDGTRVLCTLLHIQDNHVISTVSPDEWFTNSIVGKRKAFGRFGPMWKVTVGAINANPRKFTSQYRRMFDSLSIPCKLKLGSFLVTEDAIVSPGTKLDVRHFNVGQYVAVTGKTIDWGFQGGMHRWGMRGQPARGTTKSHRRIGAVGSVGDARIWPGKRMPGHMGYEWRTASGLIVLRMNPDEQVMYIKGCVPGEIGDVLLIKDCLQPKKISSNVPFPTFNEVTIKDDKEDLIPGQNDLYYENVFKMNQPSIIFTSEHETKTAVKDRTKAKIAKVKK
ncbi:39S ribosomal protein L3, mitochondrial [Strongyloides ratti]|uniref:Large ribosomal subunit protein uL3m n=1 Tax=Strongyloides ratti TaxID=34506 RepID=A0A090LDQ8_STRRB|nr:39S ribosomal protein L3, mitochondrial [Strongyloides ratti]CEF66253.1 39S ribosomal protein L3, mitochondrial [Strongyloides ratti]